MTRPDEPSSAGMTPGRAAHARFAETHRSMVLRAGHPDEPGAEAALERLCRTYWYPVYASARGRGLEAEDARDTTQEFFAKLLRRESLATVCQEKGRFRTFLIRSLQNFILDQHRARCAEKRGGAALAVMVRRLRLRCRELIMEEIMHTVQTRSEAREELQALFGK